MKIRLCFHHSLKRALNCKPHIYRHIVFEKSRVGSNGNLHCLTLTYLILYQSLSYYSINLHFANVRFKSSQCLGKDHNSLLSEVKMHQIRDIITFQTLSTAFSVVASFQTRHSSSFFGRRPS